MSLLPVILGLLAAFAPLALIGWWAAWRLGR
jgi:hypothetical protein